MLCVGGGAIILASTPRLEAGGWVGGWVVSVLVKSPRSVAACTDVTQEDSPTVTFVPVIAPDAPESRKRMGDATSSAVMRFSGRDWTERKKASAAGPSGVSNTCFF